MKKIHLFGLSILSSILLSLAWPANGFAPIIFVALVPLLLLQDEMGGTAEKPRRKGFFGIVYLSFVIWNILTTWWIWNSTDIGSIAAIGLNSFLAFSLDKNQAIR
jgi:apolipoprotein N-acyltransferase